MCISSPVVKYLLYISSPRAYTLGAICNEFILGFIEPVDGMKSTRPTVRRGNYTGGVGYNKFCL